jgi:Leucine-rich repeat (LRR) protein
MNFIDILPYDRIYEDIPNIELTTSKFVKLSDITMFNKIPLDVEYLDISDIRLIEIPSIVKKFVNLKVLNLNNNNVSYINNLPDSIILLYCEHNNIQFLNKLPNSLLVIHCCRNRINNITNLPQHIENIHCSNNVINSLHSLPNSMHTLHCSNNSMETLELPNSLVRLSCSNNNLTKLDFTQNLEYVDISINNIKRLDYFPDSITDFYYYKNNFDENIKQIMGNGVSTTIVEIRERINKLIDAGLSFQNTNFILK